MMRSIGETLRLRRETCGLAIDRPTMSGGNHELMVQHVAVRGAGQVEIRMGAEADHRWLAGLGRKIKPKRILDQLIGRGDGYLAGKSLIPVRADMGQSKLRRRPPRRSGTWGSSCHASERTAGPPLGDRVIPLKRSIGGRGPNLQH